MVYRFLGGILVRNYGFCCCDGFLQFGGSVARAVTIEFVGLRNGVTQTVFVGIHVCGANRGVAKQFHEVQAWLGEIGGTLVGIGIETYLNLACGILGQFETDGVCDPYADGEGGEAREFPWFACGYPCHSATPGSLVAAVVEGGDKGIAAGWQYHLLIEEHRLLPASTQGEHTAVGGAVLSYRGDGCSVEGFLGAYLIDACDGVVDGDVLGPAFHVKYLLGYIACVIDSVVEIGVKA